MRLTIALWLCLVSSAWAAPTFDAQSESTMFDATSFNWTHTVGGGCASNIVYVAIGFGDATTMPITGVTIGGSAATQVTTVATTSGVERITTFYRTGVGTGNKAIAVTFSGTNGIAIGTARSYCDVHQTVPLGTAATAGNDASDTVTVDVTSAAGELVVDTGLIISLPATASVGAGQTQRSNLTDLTAASFRQVESDEAGAASVTMSWGLEAAHAWITTGVSLKPVGAAPTARRRKVIIIE